MIRELIVVRHAHAAEAEARQQDSERELSPKGYQDAARLGYHLNERQQGVDLVLASTAQRAQSTAEILAEQMHCSDQKLRLLEELYQASVRSALNLIHQQNEEIRQLMIVGHNPTLTYLVEYLSGEPIDGLVPGGLFLLRLDVDHWAEVAQHEMDIVAYITPDQLREGSHLR